MNKKPLKQESKEERERYIKNIHLLATHLPWIVVMVAFIVMVLTVIEVFLRKG